MLDRKQSAVSFQSHLWSGTGWNQVRLIPPGISVKATESEPHQQNKTFPSALILHCVPGKWWPTKKSPLETLTWHLMPQNTVRWIGCQQSKPGSGFCCLFDVQMEQMVAFNRRLTLPCQKGPRFCFNFSWKTGEPLPTVSAAWQRFGSHKRWQGVHGHSHDRR